jgi:hypothetical protein
VYELQGDLKSSPYSGFREEFPHPIDEERSNWVCFGRHLSGWLQEKLFNCRIEYFVAEVKPSKEEPGMLICDGNYFYISNLNTVVLARGKL